MLEIVLLSLRMTQANIWFERFYPLAWKVLSFQNFSTVKLNKSTFFDKCKSKIISALILIGFIFFTEKAFSQTFKEDCPNLAHPS